MYRLWCMLLIIGIGLFFSETGYAQPKDDGAETIKIGGHYRRIQKVDFEGSTISGGKGGPGDLTIIVRLGAKHEKLIKLRKDWKEKTQQSVNLL